jgi:DNA-3-methyladenine glycosylase II
MAEKRIHTRKAAARRTGKPRGPRYHPGSPIDDEERLLAATEALRRKDPDLIATLLAVGGRPPLRRRDPGFAGLASIIVSQQVSVASASAIFARLKTRVVPLEARLLASTPEEDLRACGLSAGKIRTLRAAAEAVGDGALDLAGLAALDAEQAHDALVGLKGVGPWTADIFLLFCLGHPDAFPAGDLALQEAAKLALRLKVRPDAARLERIAERWRPWRGVAARMLWAYYRGRKARSGMALADPSIKEQEK